MIIHIIDFTFIFGVLVHLLMPFSLLLMEKYLLSMHFLEVLHPSLSGLNVSRNCSEKGGGGGGGMCKDCAISLSPFYTL